MDDDFYTLPMITPEAIELAVMLGAVDFENVCKVFGVRPLDDDAEIVFNALRVLVKAGHLMAHVSHEDPLNVRTVYETKQALDFPGGAS